MNKKTFSVIVFISAMLISLVAGVNINLVKAQSPKTIIVPDDYPTIQDAINAANPGDTVYVRNGEYFGTINITKSMSLVGQDRTNTIINANEAHRDVIAVNASNVTIEGLAIENSQILDVVGDYAIAYSGINLGTSPNCTISNNIIAYDPDGVTIGSSDNIVEGNFIASCGVGISISSASGSLIMNNIETNDSVPLGMYNGAFDNVTSNYFSIGIFPEVDSSEIGYTTDVTSAIYLESCENCLFTRNTFSNAEIFLSLNTEYNRFYQNNFQNTFKENEYGAYIGDEAGVNYWDNGTAGNYWNYYQTIYPNATEIDNTGIGNTPYNITSGSPIATSINVDYFPVMQPFNNTALTIPFPFPTITPSPSNSKTPSPSPTTSPSIPEFPTWIILPSIILITAFWVVGAILIKRRR
jgi:hypothetical protein